MLGGSLGPIAQSWVNPVAPDAEVVIVAIGTRNRDPELELEIFAALNHRFPYFFIIINPDLSLGYVSAGSDALIGFTAEELMTRTVDQLVHPEDLDTAIPMALEMMSTGEESIGNPSAAHSVEIPIRIGTADGDWCAMMLAGRVLDEAGRILCVLRPNGERHALDRVLRMIAFGTESGADLTSTLDAVLDLLLTQFPAAGAAVTGADGRVIISRGEATDLQIDGIEEVETKWNTTVYRDSSGLEYWGLEIVGDLTQVDYGHLLMVAPRPGGPSPYDALVMRGTTDLVRLSFARVSFDRMLTEAANTDHLTGVLNRRAVEQHLHSIDRDRDEPVGMLFIDLDGFKEINDRWGHAVGDEVLRRASRRISSTLRDDDLLARLGGDEFIVVCRSVDDATVEMIRDRITTSLRQPIEVNGILIPVSASIGAAVTGLGLDVDELFTRSDLDMYQRKSAKYALQAAGEA